MRSRSLVMAAFAGAALFAAQAQAASTSDAFNRRFLGTIWTSVAGKLTIANDQMVSKTPSLGYQVKSSDSSASVVVFLGGTDIEYGAISLGNDVSGGDIFVKLQEQEGGGTFDHAAFANGNNNDLDFFALASPVSSPAVLDVTVCGTVATMRITSAAGVQSYSYDYGAVPGVGAGLGTYGAVALDNLVGFKPDCAQAPAAVPARLMRHDLDKSLIR